MVLSGCQRCHRWWHRRLVAPTKGQLLVPVTTKLVLLVAVAVPEVVVMTTSVATDDWRQSWPRDNNYFWVVINTERNETMRIKTVRMLYEIHCKTAVEEASRDLPPEEKGIMNGKLEGFSRICRAHISFITWVIRSSVFTSMNQDLYSKPFKVFCIAMETFWFCTA